MLYLQLTISRQISEEGTCFQKQFAPLVLFPDDKNPCLSEDTFFIFSIFDEVTAERSIAERAQSRAQNFEQSTAERERECERERRDSSTTQSSRLRYY